MSLLLALLLAADPPGLYQRVEQRLARDPALAASLERPAPEMAQVAWLVGTWDVFAEAQPGSQPERGTSVVTPVFGGVWLEIRDTYPGGTQDIGYIGYNMARRLWVSVAIDSIGNANRTEAPGWQDGRAAFEGDALILDLRTHLRQTVERLGPDEYRVTNEELLDGAWRRLDSYRYRRRPAA